MNKRRLKKFHARQNTSKRTNEINECKSPMQKLEMIEKIKEIYIFI